VGVNLSVSVSAAAPYSVPLPFLFAFEKSLAAQFGFAGMGGAVVCAVAFIGVVAAQAPDGAPKSA
jgi:hypothetical protein